ncbi:cytochrome P450 [Streptomyces sp. NPDC015130]|uniref:cytochrome P450 family protein n=1 Tax=Streptomyces sp. NPDC015130 TaxID=3364940 RepID=UPI003702543A
MNRTLEGTTASRPVLDLAALGQDFAADPYPTYARLRAEGPAHRVRTPEGEEVWLVLGYDMVRSVLADPRFSKDWNNSATPPTEAEEALSHNMLESDPPRHTRLRKLVAREFTMRRVELLRPRVQAIVDGLMDAMLAAPEGRADLMESLAWPLPVTVISELLGVPEPDRAAFRVWTDAFVFPDDPAQAQVAMAEMSAYLSALIDSKRGQDDEDLLGALVRTSDEDGSRLTSEELLGMAHILLVAGHETTVNLIGNGMHALLSHPDQLAALRADMTLLDGAVEEMLRYEGPVESATYRFPVEDVDLGGTVIPAGETVLVVLADAHRTPERFPDPHRFDIRRDTGGHLAFGHGIHFCIGAPLARMEARIAVRALLERCPDLALDASPGELVWYPNPMIRGLRALPVRWRRGREAGRRTG